MSQDRSSVPDPSDSPATAGPPSGLPGYLGTGSSESGPPAPAAPSQPSLRILLMGLAILVTGFVLFRSMAVEGSAGGTAGYDWQVVTPDGEPVNLDRYKGRPVLLNVWATWCGPCMMEMPSLIALSARPELKEADVAIVLVSTDGDLEPVRRFLERTDVGNAEVLVAATSPPGAFRTSGIPATFLIDPEGTIVRQEIGAMDWNTPEVVKELVSLKKAK